ncbi:hypothetical protein [Halococcus saccharolyticus]|uniref:Uncharacterized protein n=1 Tax=Halococcus saccharolyticus DSM 5350 TaxID=1227455 RepID=M0MSA3_9EURY|nr:hypothetical protein [Halococcus saccharolyticus]EMA47619.1 hypothetical protein C449_01112 [Halococcus saccharolyticus DSM 5350]
MSAEAATADPPERDAADTLCSECKGPMRYDEGPGVGCMCDDPEGTPIERMICRRCVGAITFDDGSDIDPMACECPDDEAPTHYRIMSKQESIDRAREFL